MGLRALRALGLCVRVRWGCVRWGCALVLRPLGPPLPAGDAVGIHQCFNALDMPEYSSLVVLLERLEIAMTQADQFTDI